MSEYLWRVTVEAEWAFRKNKRPVYVVAKDKESALEYARKHVKKQYNVTKASKLGLRLGNNFFHGGEK